MLRGRTSASATIAEVRCVVGELRVGCRELLDRLTCKNLAHEVAIYTIARNRRRHTNLITATDPHCGGKLRSDAAEPLIAPIFGSTRLTCYRLPVADVGPTTGTVGNNALHNVGCSLSERRIEDLFALGVSLEDSDAIGVLDGFDAYRFALGAAIGNGGVRLGHFAHRNLFGAQRNRRIGVQFGFDAAFLRHVRHLLRTNFGTQLSKTSVRGNGESASDGTRTVVGATVVLYLPAVDIHMAGAVKVGFRGNAFIQSGKQGERLEGRARLTFCLRCQVEFIGVVITSTDKSLDEAGIRVNRHQRELKIIGKALHLRISGRFRCLLDGRVERSDNRHAALEYLVGRIILQKRFANIAGEVLVLVHAVAGAYLGNVQVQIFSLCRIVLFLSDYPIGKHAVENQVATVLAVFGIVDGVVVRRRLGNADKSCRLSDGEVFRILVVVALGGSLNTIGALAIVNGVQVHLKDFVLGVRFLQFNGDIRFANLTLQRRFRSLIGQDGISHELLRNG